MNMKRLLKGILGFICLMGFLITISCKSSVMKRLNVVVELDVGESKEVELINGDIVNLSLIDIKTVRDSLRNGIRAAYLTVRVDGEEIILGSGNYNLPVTVGLVKIDCPVIKEITATSSYYAKNAVLQGDARFRLWPRKSSYIQKRTFLFPLKQDWMASRTQSQNEPAGLGWAENLASENMGYHSTHDFGGAEGMEEIFSATDGLIVSSNNEVLEEYKDLPGDVRPDVVWVVDGRGWYIRYSHLNSIEPEIKAGKNVQMGQKIGYMGKQGGSGGWVHLHFGIHYKNPETSVWEVEDAYPYLWESYVKQHKPSLMAVARPRLLARTGDEITLDGSKSVSLAGEIVSYQWIFTDGTTAEGAVQQHSYTKAGEYSETLKITDSNGNVDYDFTYVQVYDRNEPDKRIPTIHPSYYPTLNIKAGDPLTFLVRTFGSDTGDELWDFGDGSEKVKVNSGIVQHQTQNEGKYASIIHAFEKSGHYVVSVERINESGFPAIGHLHVSVD
jgi:murein DD-endopeptidase MepM/ murein hydrolase activator NlpD